MLFTSEIYETTIDALVPFLNIDTERTLRIPITQGVDYGINLVPIYALEWMDVVDFYFRANITETDKRAFEFLMIRFIAYVLHYEIPITPLTCRTDLSVSPKPAVPVQDIRSSSTTGVITGSKTSSRIN